MNELDMSAQRAATQAMLDEADLLFGRTECEAALQRVGADITAALGDKYPLVLPVMGGAVVFTGKLLPLLRFPLDFDYVHVSRYGDKLQGGQFKWLRAPQNEVAGRHVLILDDILDEGHTMAAIQQQVLSMGAASCLTAVFANKLIGKPKPITADFVGLDVPNRYVFGYGMDAENKWRNLDEIYALSGH
ncbi:hypoxanthine-guanine phosphoribosyltransferase [Snodgrassella sp. CFCC 13594]|uniref:hypoxanthine-guanine phosphoribosyltransferase n=1 Tax=Snodgrassella sp. CFCC 13594 TaxID=1775559 RepID=UPI00082DE2B3|nr:hypoxanthine-guanine phosphoribosyltransferase [Snodgrassella sp. CFCC 13594]